MPYIPSEARDRINSSDSPMNSGELNYLVTTIIDNYITDRGLGYSTLNDIMGVLSCAQHEMYRRVVSLYEDKKMLTNGDVWNPANTGKLSK